MKFTYIATAAVVPAAIAGVAITISATGHAAAGGPAPHQARHLADHQPARPTAARSTAAQSVPAKSPAAHAVSAPSAANLWVTVRAGDTLSGIAAAHHMTWQAIYATPPNTRVLHNPDALVAGERLRLPANPKLRAAQFAAKYAAGLRQSAPSQASASQASASQASASQASASQGQPAAAPAAASGGSLTAGMSAFEQCVAWRESSDTPTDPDGLFGLLPSTWQSLGYSGTAGQASVAVQEQAFSRLYAQDGTAPWAPYDGC